MSSGFQPPDLPVPLYEIEESICRYCARLRFGVRYEYPHPRMWAECVHAVPYAPMHWAISCDHFMREMGVD